jgi:hypothetical protein
MINNPSTETRLLGRYALTWNHITDWYKASVRYRAARRESIPPTNITQPVSPQTSTLPPQPVINIPMPDIIDNREQKPPKSKKTKIPHESPEKLIELEKQSHEILLKANTVFPFILFPDTIILDRTHLTIIHRIFFGVAKITSVRIEDILTADLSIGPLFGSLKVATRFFINQDTEQSNSSEIKSPAINFLWKHDALEVHKLLQGFIAATQKEIDISQVPMHDLTTLLRGLGENDDMRS